LQVTVTKDSLTPALVSLQLRIRDRKACFEAIGLYIVSVTKRAHTDASLRPHVWPPLKSGKASTLQQTTQMRRAWRVVSTDNDSVTIGNDRDYAAVHFYGGQSKPHIIKARKGKALKIPIGGGFIFRRSIKHPGSKIPRRRALPVEDDGTLTAYATAGVKDIIEKKIVLGK
jgi:phage gpG-like protein